jgi:hypothetical protein
VVFSFFPTPLLIIHGIYTLWIIHSKAGQEWMRLHHVAKPRYPLIIALVTVLILAIWTGAINTRATQLNPSTLEAEPPMVAITSLALTRIDQQRSASKIEHGEPVGVILDPMTSNSIHRHPG